MDFLDYKKRLPCAALFRQPMIRCDGSLTVCNYDIGLELKLGSVLENSISELWYGEKIQKMRLAEIVKDPQSMPEKCKNCHPDLCLSTKETMDYLKSVGRPDLIGPFKRMQGIKMAVLLVNPTISKKAPYKMTVTLGLGYIASVLREKYPVKIVNMPYSNATEQDIIRLVQEENFSVVGITGMTYQAKGGTRLAAMLKEKFPELIVIFGGVFASVNPNWILNEKNTDFVVRGEGEGTIMELMAHLDGEGPQLQDIAGISYIKDGVIIHNPDRPLMDMDSLPELARELMPSRGFIPDDTAFTHDRVGAVSAMAMFSRGCPSDCIFCASPKMWHRTIRYRKLDSMIREIQDLIMRYGIRNIVIDDDSFTVNRELVMDFCRELLDRKIRIRWRCNTKVNFVDCELLEMMKKAGCIKVTYGIESGNDSILKRINKSFTVADIKKALALNEKTGLPAGMLMIIGHPGENPETVQDSLNLVRELKPKEGWDFQVMQPHPGTRLREKIEEYGGQILSHDWDDYFSDNITYLPQAFQKDHFIELARKVTNRPIKYMGEKPRLSFSTSSNDGLIISIAPNKWDDGFFDVDPPFYWEGDETCNKGFTHALGRNKGFLEYAFDCPVDGAYLKSLTFKARMCSQNPKRKSSMSIHINGFLAGNLSLPPKSREGEIVEFILDDQEKLASMALIDGINILRFQIEPIDQKDDGDMANGLTIMQRALENELIEKELPITLILEKKKKSLYQPVPLLILDTTTFCDLSCIMCPQSKVDPNREKGTISLELWRKIFEELAVSKEKIVDAIFPFWNGEALANREFPQLIKEAMEIEKKHGNRGYSTMVLHTNGNGLNGKLTDLILDSGLFGSITFSLDALNKKTYEKLRIGGDFPRIKREIQNFIEKRGAGPSQYPYITLQFLIMEENHQEAQDFMNYWKGFFCRRNLDLAVVYDDFPPLKGDGIFFKRVVTHNPLDQKKAEELHLKTVKKLGLIKESVERCVINDEFIPDDMGKNIMNKGPIRRPCIGLWQNLGIRFDGMASACCRDFNARMSLGNLRENTLMQILTGSKLRDFRLAHIRGDFHLIPPCEKCSGQPNGSISDDEIINWLKFEGIEGEIPGFIERMKGAKNGL